MCISPNSARIEVPEKCDIPGMDSIGELLVMENSSIFLYIKKFNASVIKPKSKVYDRFSINALLKESLIDIDDLFY